MGKVSFDISMSLDGYITAANRRPKEPLGDGGEQLHEWAFNSDDEYNRKLLDGSRAGLRCGEGGCHPFFPITGVSGRSPRSVSTHICPELVDTPMAVFGMGETAVRDLRAAGSILSPDDIASGVLELIEDDSRAGAIMQITNSAGREYVKFD